MKNLLIIMIFILCPEMKAQDIVGFGNNCALHNTIGFTKALSDYFGEENVLSWLKKEHKITVYCYFNDKGKVTKIEMWRTRENPFLVSDADKDNFERHLKIGDYFFKKCMDDNYFCSGEDISTYDYESIYKYETEKVKKSGEMFFGLYFPGMLKTLCPVDRLDKEKLKIIIKTYESYVFERKF